jgi:hypothetical protein
MKRTLAGALAVSAAAALMTVAGASPIGAQTAPTTSPEPEVAVLTVTKTVDGTAPDGTQFTLHLFCTDANLDRVAQTTEYDEDVIFGATGGSKDFVFTAPSQCTVTETDDGGANSSSGPVDVDITEPIAYSAEIVNTFDPSTTTTAPAAAAAAVQTTANFTG